MFGSEYTVYAQVLFQGVLMYLLDPHDDSQPAWYPAELFELTESKLPEEWEFAFDSTEFRSGIGAIWGYREIVRNAAHYEGLIERETVALRLFARLKLKSRHD